MPFVFIGIAIAVFIGLLLTFFYLALWGIFIGAVLWLVAIAKHYFFPPQTPSQKHERIIEHDDKR